MDSSLTQSKGDTAFTATEKKTHVTAEQPDANINHDDGSVPSMNSSAGMSPLQHDHNHNQHQNSYLPPMDGDTQPVASQSNIPMVHNTTTSLQQSDNDARVSTSKATTTTTTTTPTTEYPPFSQSSPQIQVPTNNIDEPIVVETVDSKGSAKDVNDEYQRMDAHDKYAAWAIHIALIGFIGLVVLSIILALVVIAQYGLVAIVGLAMVVFVVMGIAFSMHTIIQNDARLQPIKRQIEMGIHDLQKWVVDEYDAFKEEWKNHQLLLTNGEDDSDDAHGDNENNVANHHDGEEGSRNRATEEEEKPKKKKSVLFKAIRPFLKARKKVFGRKGKKKASSSKGEKADGYSPPVGEML